MTDEPLLRLERVSKSFDGLVANRNISLSLTSGSIAGLIGPNGSGKTTLFGLICGHLRADGGRIVHDGADITSLSERAVARRGVLRTFQQPRVFHGMTCRENVLTAASAMTRATPAMLGRPDRSSGERALRMLEFAGLHRRSDDAAGDLSFGQQKLLEFAMALMASPRLLLLDEPTAGVTPAQVERILDLLRRARSEFGVTMLVIEHNIAALMRLSDIIHCLDRGTLIASGPPEIIAHDARVRSAYLGAA